MKIHEFQAKGVLARYGVPVPSSRVIEDSRQARGAAGELGSAPWVVKAQIHAGGRGKGGGVQLCRSEGELEEAAERILGI